MKLSEQFELRTHVIRDYVTIYDKSSLPVKIKLKSMLI